ncbi:hypothetical protein A7J71_24860 [Achromobacter insolitus]|nr:hypothetical protein A3839_08140 [Achromobacter insolitus]OAE63704.1 hypothetical protein A7J71_24860 [Achromobacter insolitus]OCZ61770.1 hypothetical protein A7P22_23525 [Achromobacter insolitus]
MLYLTTAILAPVGFWLDIGDEPRRFVRQGGFEIRLEPDFKAGFELRGSEWSAPVRLWLGAAMRDRERTRRYTSKVLSFGNNFP